MDDAAVIDVARRVLAEQGYRRLTVEAVADRTGLDAGALAHRWPTQADLLIDVLATVSPAADIPDRGDSRREMEMAVLGLASQYTDRHRFQRALFAFAAEHAADPELMERLRQRCLARWRAPAAAVLRRAAERGDLPPDADLDLIQDVWEGAIAYRRLISGGAVSAVTVKPLLDMVLSGMAPVREPDYATDLPLQDHGPDRLREITWWMGDIGLGRVSPIDEHAEALAAVPSTVVIDGHPVTIEAHVWRDFMPSPVPGSDRLIVTVRVAVVGGGVLRPFLRADRLVATCGDEMWVAQLVEEYPRHRTSRQFEVAARQGPLWEPDSLVDLVVRLKGEQGYHWLVRAAGLPIGSPS